MWMNNIIDGYIKSNMKAKTDRPNWSELNELFLCEKKTVSESMREIKFLVPFIIRRQYHW